MDASSQNLYLDFRKNHDQLRTQLLRLRHLHGTALFPGWCEHKDIVAYVAENFFLEGLVNHYYVSNLSLRSDSFRIALRPTVDGPRLEAELPAGKSLCFQGTPHDVHVHHAVLVVEAISDITHSVARDFEQEVAVVPIFSPDKMKNRDAETSNLLIPEFLASLLPISKITHKNLEEWNACIQWERQLCQSRLVGMRYVRLDLKEELLRFVVACPSEEHFQQAARILRQDDLTVLDVGASKSPWLFSFNDEERGYGLGLRVGEFQKTLPIKASQVALHDCPWPEPFFAQVLFELDDDARNILDEHGDGLQIGLRDTILQRYPTQGFLAISAAGELSLLTRQNANLARLEEQSGYAPFLTSWLFDIAKAHPAGTLPEVNGWLASELNDPQKQAVRTMLAADDICLVQGPPGTGKTISIAEAAYQFVKQGKKVLIASQANLAVDNVLEKLIGDPAIRPIRLGRANKISLDGKVFAEDQVLEHYYGNLSQACTTRYLGMWEQLENHIRRLETWMHEGDFIEKDLRETIERLQHTTRVHVQAREELALEQRRIVHLEAANSEIQHERDSLSALIPFLRARTEGHYVIPEPILDYLWDRLLPSFNGMRRYYIDINSFWLVNQGVSQGERTTFFRDVMDRWDELRALVPQLKADLAYLSSLPGERIVSPELHIRLRELEKQYREVDALLQNDESVYPQWKAIRAEMDRVRRESSGIGRALYGRIFTLPVNGTPFHLHLTRPDASKTEVATHLAAVLKSIGAAEATVTQVLEQAAAMAETMLAGLRPHEIDSRVLQRRQAEVQRLGLESTTLGQALSSRKEALLAHVQEHGQPDDGPQMDLLQTYRQVRATVAGELQQRRATLEQIGAFRSDWADFLKEWHDCLTDPEAAKLDARHFLSTYKAHCNVVGVTCNEHPRVLDQAEHTCFDVAIIDEVSKAKPTELIMPMMRATTSVLVGDHRQLPPLFKERQGSWQEALRQRQESLEQEEDAADELLTEENFERFRDLITASFFKKHFEAAHGSLTCSLTTQYRMHPDIMDVVNHFYEHTLTCGLKDPDKHRNHGLTVKSSLNDVIITPDRHVLWIDSSRDPLGLAHYETQAGKSKENHLEALLMIELLAQIDRACQAQGFSAEKPKQVGVISFYLRQVRLLRKMVRKLQPQALKIDVNTVDRFQGKEKPIILVSLVSHRHHAPKSAKAFVAQFERINVAFSRAQELLMIFGAKDMYYDYPVHLPHMKGEGSSVKPVYQSIINELERKGCLWMSGRPLPPHEFPEKLDTWRTCWK